MPDPGDHRRHRRVPLPGTVTGSIGFADSIRVLNLSSIGALIESAEQLFPWLSYVLNLRLAGTDLQLPAQVVWSTLHGREQGSEGPRERYRSGLHFPDIPQGTRAHIQHYLTTVAPPQEGTPAQP